MKILVTGASGFLGSYLVKRLLERGEKDIRCLIRQKNKINNLNLIINEYPDARIEFFEGDLTSKDDASRVVENVDIIYHCAATLKGSPSIMFLNTVVASKNLLNAIIYKNIKRVILVSSFSVYGVAKLPKMSVINESTPLEDFPTKRDAYSYVKYRQEMLFWEYYKKYKIPLVVVRPGVIYGPGCIPIPTRVGLNLFGLVLHLGDGNLLPLTYVENCADAIVFAGQTPGIDGEIFNIHDDDLPTSKEYLKMYKKYVKKIRSITIPYFLLYQISKLIEKYHKYSKGQLPDIFTPYKTASYWKSQQFDNRKAKQVLGWTPSISTENGLKTFFKYLTHKSIT